MLPGWIHALVLPPLCPLVLVGVGLALVRWRRRTGWGLVLGGIVLLVALSTPLVSGLLIRSLEPPLAEVGQRDPRARAIVVLGGDVELRAPEYGGITVGALSLERLRYAASLQRETGLPVLVTGGTLRPEMPPLAELMRRVLVDELGVPVTWVEPEARNTYENALFSVEILRGAGVEYAYLVTHAWHVPRACERFRAAGLAVVPAPTGFRLPPRADPLELLPTARAQRESALALHEWLGRAWYRLRHGV